MFQFFQCETERKQFNIFIFWPEILPSNKMCPYSALADI